MTDTFRLAVEAVLSHEGGLSDDPLDPGGLTRWGISQRAYPELDIRQLTREQAIDLYREDCWERLRCGDLPPAVAVALFDTAVNQGAGSAVRMLQQSLGVTTDGLIGPRTIAAAYGVPAGDLLVDFLARRAVRYAETPTFPHFGRGWMRRLFSVHTVCLSLSTERRT